MSYMTVSVRSRQINARTPTQPGSRKLFPPDSRHSASPRMSAMESLSLFSGRQLSATVPEPTLSFWEENKAPVAVLLSFVVVMAISIYFLARTNARPSAKPTPIEQQQGMAWNPSTVNIRPMGIASTRLSSFSNASDAKTERATEALDGAKGNITEDMRISGSGRPASGNPASTEEIYAAMSSGRKLVLPDNVAGHCAIGGQAIRNLSHCMAQNGARAE